jgi:hypothetical protein
MSAEPEIYSMFMVFCVLVFLSILCLCGSGTYKPGKDNDRTQLTGCRRVKTLKGNIHDRVNQPMTGQFNPRGKSGRLINHVFFCVIHTRKSKSAELITRVFVVSQSLLRHFIFCAHILNFLPAV